MAAAKKKVDLLMVLGKKPDMGGGMMSGKKDPDAADEGSEYGGEFEAAAGKALGTDDPERIDAFWQAVRACMDRGE